MQLSECISVQQESMSYLVGGGQKLESLSFHHITINLGAWNVVLIITTAASLPLLGSYFCIEMRGLCRLNSNENLFKPKMFSDDSWKEPLFSPIWNAQLCITSHDWIVHYGFRRVQTSPYPPPMHVMSSTTYHNAARKSGVLQNEPEEDN